MTAAAGGMLGAIVYGALLLSSYRLALRLLPQASISVRWAGTLGIGLWILVALFWLLAPFRLFRLTVVLLILVASALVASRRGVSNRELVSRIREDIVAGFAFLRMLIRQPFGWPLILLGAAAFVRCLRGSGSPPLGWDALTYHLLRAGRWVQEGGLVSEIAPDAWSYYEHYPFAGDIIWAWAMLPLHGDGLLTLGGSAVWLVILLGVYASARSLGAGSRNALLAAGALGASPSVLTYLSSAYVDNLSLATFLLGSVFVVRLAQGGDPREAPLASGLLGLMLGVKTITAPLFIMGIAVVVWRLWRAKHRKVLMALCILTALVGSPGYFKAWVEKDSPIYPFGLQIAGKTIFEGNEEVALVSSGGHLAARHQLDSPVEALSYLTFRRTREGAFVNPGPGAPWILLMGLLGVGSLLREKRDRWATGYLLFCGLILVGLFFSNYMVFSRTTIYVTTVGRFLSPVLGVSAILGAVVGGRFAISCWALATVLGVVWSRPVAWSVVERPLMLSMLALACLALAMAMALKRLPSSRVRGQLTLLAIGILAAGLVEVRDAHRYPIWAAATHPKKPLFHMHRLHPFYAAAWPLWQRFDDGEPYLLAATAGWDGQGHNWYRYPLLGSRLQNKVIYESITRDGSVVDYRLQGTIQDRASFPAWVTRLQQSEVEFVLSLAPRTTIEDRWLARADKVFILDLEDPAGLHAAFRVESLPSEQGE